MRPLTNEAEDYFIVSFVDPTIEGLLAVCSVLCHRRIYDPVIVGLDVREGIAWPRNRSRYARVLGRYFSSILDLWSNEIEHYVCVQRGLKSNGDDASRIVAMCGDLIEHRSRSVRSGVEVAGPLWSRLVKSPPYDFAQRVDRAQVTSLPPLASLHGPECRERGDIEAYLKVQLEMRKSSDAKNGTPLSDVLSLAMHFTREVARAGKWGPASCKRVRRATA